MAGVVRPGIDLKRLEDAHEDWFKRIWGLRMGKIQEVAYREMRYFMREYRDLIAETPFQFQAEMLFVARAIGILAGMATHLDTDFDPWAKAIPYAKQFAKEELRADWKGWPEEAILWGNHLVKIPANLDTVLEKARQGNLAIQVSLSPQTRSAIRRIDLSVKRFSWMVLAAGLLVSGVNLYIAHHNGLGVLCILLALVVFLWGVRKV
jgi:predicted unusual protein kinase regulating ubiquinone biosynthesis (AarF/ABC1/UbiB family)